MRAARAGLDRLDTAGQFGVGLRMGGDSAHEPGTVAGHFGYQAGNWTVLLLELPRFRRHSALDYDSLAAYERRRQAVA